MKILIVFMGVLNVDELELVRLSLGFLAGGSSELDVVGLREGLLNGIVKAGIEE